MNITDYLLEQGNPESTALVTPKREYTYRELKQATAGMIEAFQSAGINSGDRVGILGSNSLFWVSSYLAGMKMGAVTVPLATKLPPSELTLRIEQTGCKGLCVEKRLQKRYGGAFSNSLFVMNEDAFEVEHAAAQLSESAIDFDEHQDAAWMLTSGTTARPRIVRITHANIRANTDAIIESLGLTRADRIMAILPFYYCFGTSLLHTHLRVGGSLVPGDTLGFPEKVLDLMEQTACTGFAGVPTTFQMYLRNSTFPQRAMPSLRHIQQAGGKLSPVLIDELTQSRPRADIYIMYGQTEATARLSCLQPEDLPSKLGSIGKGIPGVSLQVLNEDGKEVRAGEVGEIVARGGNISPGYVGEPEINAEKFVHGSLRTGDMATVDEDGYIYIVDRKSDFIKSYGNRVSSQEIEACILEIKEVTAAAVIGVPDPLRGEAIRAFVVLRANAVFNEATVIEYCAKRLARYMVPKDVIFTRSLPVNEHGKVVKSELRKL